MPQRAYSYGRVSTKRQAKGSGLERQQGQLDEEEAWVVRVCRENGWVLDDEPLTDAGRSGYHKKNLTPKAKLTKFLNWIERGRVAKGSVLLIDKLDRLTRAELDEAHELFMRILKAGVWICTKDPARVYKYDPTKPRQFMDVMEPLWIMYCNWLESEKKSVNLKGVWRRNRHLAKTEKKAHQGPPPWWIAREGGKYRLKDRPGEPEMGWLREMIRRSLAGEGGGEIANRLNKQGAKGSKGKRWRECRVIETLRNRRLVGEYRPRELVEGKYVEQEPIAGYYPPVLTEEEFQELQRSIDRRRRGRGRRGHAVNMLLGLVWEAETGESMFLQSSQPAEGEGPRNYYQYLRVAKKGGPSVKYADVATWVLETVTMLRPEDVMDRKEEATEREKEIGRLAAKWTALERRLKQLQVAAANPEEELEDILPSIRQVKEEMETTARERDRLKLESRSGRVEALAETQETIRARREAASKEERDDLDKRIREAMPSYVSGIWIQVQPIKYRVQIAHVQVWLRNGSMRYFALLPRKMPAGVKPWQLGPDDGWDLRHGPFVPTRNNGNIAPMAESA